MNGNWPEAGLVNTSYGDCPAPVVSMQFWVESLLKHGFTHSVSWSQEYAFDSALDTSGFTLIHDHIAEGPSSLYDSSNQLYCNEHVAFFLHTFFDYNRRKIRFRLIADSEENRTAAVKQLKSGLHDYPKTTEPTKISVKFWRRTMQGAESFDREIDFRAWQDIKGNYPAESAGVLQKLISTHPGSVKGKIALLYGPAGTGKTTFLCSLAHAWLSWASMEYVIDPEVFLNDANYIINVMLGDDPVNRHRLVILEDTGDLIKETAKGQGLSRLLNLADGILGSGRNLMFALTTNESVHKLHPALTRPGRCLAQAEIGKMSVSECQEWLGSPVTEAMTLAELYNVKDGLGKTAPSAVSDGHATGVYL